jgi:hypothetical protein
MPITKWWQNVTIAWLNQSENPTTEGDEVARLCNSKSAESLVNAQLSWLREHSEFE